MKKVISLISIFVLAFFLFPTVSLAQQQRQIETITLNEEQTVNKDYFAAADIVNIYGTVKGDVYAAGGEVRIDGVVDGDVLVAGGNITISGEVTQDVRVAGGQIYLTGIVGRNVSIAGGNVTISKDAQINGSLTMGAGNVTIDGAVAKDITAGVGQLAVNGIVGGDMLAGVGQLRVSPAADIKGGVTYYSDNDATIESPSSIKGEVVKNALNLPEQPQPQEIRNGFRAAFSTIKILGLISFLIVGLIIAKIYPNYSQRVATNIDKKPWASLGWGSLLAIVTPIASVVLFITIIGFPIGVITITLFGIFAYVAKYFAMVWVGSKLLTKNTTLYKNFLLGFVIFAILSFIPIVSGITKLVAFLFGLGAMAISCKETYTLARKQKIA